MVRVPGATEKLRHPRLDEVAGSGSLAIFVDRSQIGLEVFCERLGVGEPGLFGVFLDEEVERVDHLHVGDEADGDGQAARPVRKDQPGKEVAEGVLLPVDEVVGGFDHERVGLDRGA